MRPLREYKVSTVIEALAKVEEVSQEWERTADAAGRPRPSRPVFRGESKDRPLLPAIYRPSNAPRNPKKNMRLQEWDMFHMFTTHSPRFFGSMAPPSSGYEWLCLMQHYGVPTRLLDWTFSPLPALFFALEKYSDAEPVLWMLDWTKFNETAGVPEFPKPHELSAYWPPAFTDEKVDASALPELPAAILLPHSNHRVGAQSGCFVVFGTSMEPLQVSQGDALVKIVLDASRNDENHYYLLNLGVSDSNLFADLAGLGNEVKRRYTKRGMRK